MMSGIMKVVSGKCEKSKSNKYFSYKLDYLIMLTEPQKQNQFIKYFIKTIEEFREQVQKFPAKTLLINFEKWLLIKARASGIVSTNYNIAPSSTDPGLEKLQSCLKQIRIIEKNIKNVCHIFYYRTY